MGGGKGDGKGPGHRLFVGNLPFAVDWKYLKDLFRDNGINVLHTLILEDRKTGRSKGSAIVEVAEEDDVLVAIDSLNEMEIEGRFIVVREDHGPGGGKGDGGDRFAQGRSDAGDYGGAGGKDKGKGRPVPSTSWHAEGGGAAPRPSRSERYDPRPQGAEARRPQAAPQSPPHPPKARPLADGVRVMVEHLPPGYPWQRVKDLCRDNGIGVKHANIYGRNRDCAVVELADGSLEAARDAVGRLSGLSVEGMRISARLEDAGPPNGAGYDDGGYADAPERPHRASEDWQDWRGRGDRGGSGGFGGGAAKRAAPEGPAAEDTSLRRLFAENLSPSMDWKQLKDLFKDHFQVLYTDVVLIGRDEAYGIIEFTSRSEALEACMQFNGVLLDNERPVRLRQDRGEFMELRATKRRRVEEPPADDYARADQRRPQAHDGRRGFAHGHEGKGGGKGGGGPRVFVGNLDFKVSWQDLKDHMRQAGDVRFCDVLQGPDGRPKGCALVEYASEEECECAIDTLHDTTLGSRLIYVRKAKDGPPPGRH